MKECEVCNGDGVVDVMDCNRSAQDCCGGCYKEVHCKECNGCGEVEDEEE